MLRLVSTPKMNNLLIGSLLILSQGCVSANQFNIYPEIYQNVFNDASNSVAMSSSSVTTGFNNIYNTVTQELNATRACLNSLTLTQATQCYTSGQTFVENNMWNSWTKRDFLSKARFRNLFVPGYVDKTLGMMIFDTSFKYFGEFGFHEQAQLVIKQCALAMCVDTSNDIVTELKDVNTKYNSKNAEGIAGNHHNVDWSKMVETYNKNGLASPTDNYNLWMPNLEASEPWHQFNFNITEVSLADNEKKSWYTAMRFAIVHHFHHYYLFGDEGLFTMGFQTSENELLTEAEKQFKDSSLMEEEFLQKFAQMQARQEFTVGKMRSFTDFKQRVHEEGINYILGRETNYERFIFELGKPTTWYRTSLMKKLGFKETPERIESMVNLGKGLYALKYTLWEIELKNQGKYINTMFMLALPYAILAVFMLIFICKGLPYFAVVIRLLAACCRCIFCIKKKVEPEEEDELLSMYADRFGRPASTASQRSRPASKQQSTRADSDRGQTKINPEAGEEEKE